jgi:hypothetical protein
VEAKNGILLRIEDLEIEAVVPGWTIIQYIQ